MSAIMTGLVWDLPILGEFGRPEKYILLAYADHADQNGRSIYPSVELISKKTGYEERAVQTITRSLEKLGYLVSDGQGPHGTNRWLIPLFRGPQGAKIAPLPMLKNAPEEIAPEGNAPELKEVVKESTTTRAGGQNLFTIYEQNFGPLTPMIAETLQDAEKTYPAEWIENAMSEAVANNKRNWKYVEAILKRWQVDGPNSPKPKTGGEHANKHAKPGKAINPTGARPRTPEDDARAARINQRRRQRHVPNRPDLQGS
jgi:DnaD/phage-associated family protein